MSAAWIPIIELIARYGLPWALELYKIIKKHPEPTDEAWKELETLADKTYDQYIEDVKKRLGIP